jgi:hypothetical protein
MQNVIWIVIPCSLIDVHFKLESTIFWNITQCNLLKVNQHFGENIASTSGLNKLSKILVWKEFASQVHPKPSGFLPVYRILQPRRLYPSKLRFFFSTLL